MKYTAALLAAAVLTWTVGFAQAAALRNAEVGDSMASLVQGLVTKQAEPFSNYCAPYGIETRVARMWYVVPGRIVDEDHDSFTGVVSEDGSIILLIAYDEIDSQTPLAVYVDETGDGIITGKFGSGEWPGPCAVIGAWADNQ